MSLSESSEEKEGDGETLLKELNDLFELDPLMYVLAGNEAKLTYSCRNEFGLILTTSPEEIDSNDRHDHDFEHISDAFLLHNHKLGVSFWCIPILYSHAQKELQSLIQKSKSPPRDIVMQLSRAVLLVNAENGLALNARKSIVASCPELLSSELAFVELIFSKHPKSGEAWFHRRWVLDQIGISSWNAEQEFAVCERAVELYPKNYFAWTHRVWFAKRIASTESCALETELTKIEDRLGTHVGDYSGFHYRQQLLMILRPDFTTSTMEHEIDLTNNLIHLYPGHESPWIHRRYIMWRCCTRAADTIEGKENSIKDDAYPLPSPFSEELRYCYDAMSDTIPEFLEVNRRFAERHLLWVLKTLSRHIENVPVNQRERVLELLRSELPRDVTV